MFQEFLAVQDISFQVREGEAWGLIGSNGSGKSTMLKAISGILKPHKGSVTVNGVSLTVCNPTEDTFQVAIIPYTFEHTNFHAIGVGSVVNLEFDIIGTYLSRMMRLTAE